MSYNIAWAVAVTAAGILTVLIYFSLKRFKFFAFWVITLGCFWALWPWEFEDGFFAPLFAVFFYQTFLETDADPAAVTAFGVLGSACICLVFAAILFLRRAARSNKKSVKYLNS